MKDKGEKSRMEMVMMLGMQWLKAGQDYEIGVQNGLREGYMLRSLEGRKVMGRNGLWQMALIL